MDQMNAQPVMPVEPGVPTANRKHSPILCALSHVLIFGGVYLYLRLYTRFFIFYVAMLISGFIPVPYLPFLVIVSAMIDTFLQVKGINEGEIQKEPYHKGKHIGGTVLIIASIVASAIGYSSFMAWR